MKNKKIVSLLCLILTMISLMTSVVWAEGGSFSTLVNTGGSTSSASSSDMAWAPVTGTRYAIRINGEDIGSTTVGGKGVENYWVNHVRDTTKNGLDYYNPSASEEKEGVKNKRNFEMVYVGNNVNCSIFFKGTEEKYYFFDTPASSIDSYITELNGVTQYRHVIVWKRSDQLNDTKKYVNFTNFGLNKSDIEKLVAAIDARANDLNDDATLNQIKQIKSGKVDFEIRAEILMSLRMPTNSGTKKKIGTNNIVTDKDCYAEYSYATRSYYTYREATLVLQKLREKEVGTDDWWKVVHYRFGSVVAPQLYEDDDKYINEYKDECEKWDNLSTVIDARKKTFKDTKTKLRDKMSYYNGWDYMQFENPYQADQTTVTETAILVNADGSETILSGPTETKITEDKTFTRSENSYTYTGLVFDSGEKSLVTSQLVEADNGTHTIVYWYEVEKKTTITINYKDEKTGENICPSEMVEPGTHSKIDFDGYEYTGLEIVKPTPESKDPNKTSVTITDDKEAHEVTFWYKPEEITIIKVTHKSKGGQILQDTTSYTIKENGSSQTFSQIASALGGGWNYVGVDAICDGNTLKDQATDTSVTVSYNGSVTYEITFWYAMQTQVKIMGRCEGMSQPIYQTEASIEDLPLNKVYKEKDYTPSKAYEFLGEYEVKEGTLGWTSKGSTETGNSATLDLDEATTTPQQILIVFYYESKYTLTVNHIYVDPITGNEKVEKTISDIQIIPGEEKSVSSISMNNYLNLKYEPSSEVTAVGFTKYSKAQNNVYTLKFTPSEKNYTINFYYTSQTITVKHIQNNEVKKEETKVLDPNHGEEALTEYPFQKWVLNETEIGTETPKKVQIKEGTPSQELIFYYQEPNLIFGDPDPNPDSDPDSDPSYIEMVNQTGIIPSDLNNQAINQNEPEYYWVLNQNGELLIRFAITHLEEGSGSYKFDAKIKIPFDVYVGEVLRSANSELTVNCKYKQTSNGYDIYTGTLENIYVPIWVTEDDYEITGTVVSTYTSKAGSIKTIKSNASTTVKVVGAVYDFTITNLDGADLTGDTMWKKALFGAAEEYKATETAVGQAAQQSKNYNYGIKRGTRFYFSLNTLGAKNKKIEIVPSFYYVSADGTQTKVTMKSNYLNETRSISLTDANRTTTEFKNERAKKTGKTNATTFTVGNYNKITLDSNVNTPYLGIASELAVKDVKDGVTLSNYANHWYGDYSIPNDAKFYKADGTLVSDETGVVVVYFKIKTLDDKNTEYLAYNGDSPFNQSKEISEWDYERGSVGNSMTMPKVSTSAAKEVSNIWKKDTSTAAIIYSLRASATTKQNVTSVGTH